MTDTQVTRFSTLTEATALITLCASLGRKSLDIFTQQLNPDLFGFEPFSLEVSRIARRHRTSHVRILVQDTKPLQGRQHPLLSLNQRLPSKISIRRLTETTEAPATGFCIADQRAMVFFNDEGNNIGFYSPQASAEAKHALLEFEHLWQSYSEEDQELRALAL
jgi:hypothetical protein